MCRVRDRQNPVGRKRRGGQLGRRTRVSFPLIRTILDLRCLYVERRRAAYCVLLIDTQLSAFWNQHVSRQLSIFAHNLELPCPKSQWEALSAVDWMRVCTPPDHKHISSNGKKPRSSLLPGLYPEFQVSVVSEGYSRSLLSALGAEQPSIYKVDHENALSVEMILIGLMAVAWDCRTRGSMGIRFKEGTKHYRMAVLHGEWWESDLLCPIIQRWPAPALHVE